MNKRMRKNVKREEVKEFLGCEITDEQFNQALEYARRKQKYISHKNQSIL